MVSHERNILFNPLESAAKCLKKITRGTIIFHPKTEKSPQTPNTEAEVQPKNETTENLNPTPLLSRLVSIENQEYAELLAMVAADKEELTAVQKPTESPIELAESAGVRRNALTGDLFDPRLNWELNGMVKVGTKEKQKEITNL